MITQCLKILESLFNFVWLHLIFVLLDHIESKETLKQVNTWDVERN